MKDREESVPNEGVLPDKLISYQSKGEKMSIYTMIVK